MRQRMLSPPSSVGSSSRRRPSQAMSSPRSPPGPPDPDLALAAAPSPRSGGTSIAAGFDDEDGMYANLEPPTPSRSQGAAASRRLVGQAGNNSPSQGTFITVAGSSGINDFDSTNMANYPASMTSSVRAHVYEGGLRYHAYRDGKYALPNDEIEQNRDDMKHAMTLMLMRGKYFYAPVEDVLEQGGEVYDLGTGTGIWAIELAEKYPNGVMRGVDLSPIQPNFVPSNVYFVVDDLEDEWVYPENTFDFIHIRHTLFSLRDRKALLEKVYKHLKPGGYVEFQEMDWTPQCDDDSMTADTPYALRDFASYMEAGLAALGSDSHAVLGLAEGMRAAGFADVNQTTHKSPIGVWPRDRRLRYCGLFMRTSLMDGLRGLAQRPLANGLGWSRLQIEMFLVDVRRAVMDSQFHAYFPFHVVYGQKPLP